MAQNHKEISVNNINRKVYDEHTAKEITIEDLRRAHETMFNRKPCPFITDEEFNEEYQRILKEEKRIFISKEMKRIFEA